MTETINNLRIRFAVSELEENGESVDVIAFETEQSTSRFGAFGPFELRTGPFGAISFRWDLYGGVSMTPRGDRFRMTTLGVPDPGVYMTIDRLSGDLLDFTYEVDDPREAYYGKLSELDYRSDTYFEEIEEIGKPVLNDELTYLASFEDFPFVFDPSENNDGGTIAFKSEEAKRRVHEVALSIDPALTNLLGDGHQRALRSLATQLFEGKIGEQYYWESFVNGMSNKHKAVNRPNLRGLRQFSELTPENILDIVRNFDIAIAKSQKWVSSYDYALRSLREWLGGYDPEGTDLWLQAEFMLHIGDFDAAQDAFRLGEILYGASFPEWGGAVDAMKEAQMQMLSVAREVSDEHAIHFGQHIPINRPIKVQEPSPFVQSWVRDAESAWASDIQGRVLQA